MVHSHSRDSEHLPRLQDPVLEHAEKGTTQKEKNNNAMKSFRTATITTILTSDLIFPKWQQNLSRPFSTNRIFASIVTADPVQPTVCGIPTFAYA